MRALVRRARCESGQVLVFVVVVLFVLVGMAALVIDGGSWYRAQRQLQGAADAAALAGAQEIPTGPAQAVALDYAQKNYTAPSVTFPDADCPATSCIHVSAKAKAPGFLAGIFGSILDADGNVTVGAQAEARISSPELLKNVAPIAVYKDEACIVTQPTCFDKQVTLAFDEDDPFDPTKSKFGLLDLDRNGSAGAGDMKDWLDNGYPDYLPIDTVYPPANGEKNGIKQQLQDAADDRRVLLFPIYDTATTAGYHIIGWAAFVIDDIGKWAGQEHVLTGHFVTFIATDLAAGNPSTDPSTDFGVHVITLTK
jgi:hypothetical protein